MISESRPGSREEPRLDVAFGFRDCKANMKKTQTQTLFLKMHFIDNYVFLNPLKHEGRFPWYSEQ